MNDIEQIVDASATVQPDGTTIQRRDDAPETTQARKALVARWCDDVRDAREYWTRSAFRRMVEDQRFCSGKQWPDSDSPENAFNQEATERYVANITLRHIQTRTASLYGKNPKIVAHVKKRMMNQIWDGSSQSLTAAMEAMQMGDMNAAMIVQEAQTTLQTRTQLRKMADTLELMFEHEMAEQPVPFKASMKSTVRRGLTTGVGWVKLGYERVMELPPEEDARIEVVSQQLAVMERLSADRADGDIQDDDPETEQLRIILAELKKTEQIVVREGLRYTFPGSTAIIPDKDCVQLRGFVGSQWAAEEYFLSGDRIKEVYNVDMTSRTGSTTATDDDTGGRPKAYSRVKHGTFKEQTRDRDNKTRDQYYCVWEIYNKADGMTYTVCDGHNDFLVEPSAPDVYLERFWPWFGFIVNEVYDDDMVFPPSDVRQMRDMQMELNRSRQGQREHRVAARPRTVSRKGVLSNDDKDSMSTPIAHQHFELDSLAPGENINTVIQALQHPGVDPNLYDTSGAYEDYMRSLGQQEANLGGTSGTTATESAIAEGSRSNYASAVVDDLDEFLTELARASGQVLLLEMPSEKVVAIVGPGAVWPTLSKEQIAREIYLEVEASSTGRPNQQQEIQNAQAVFPLLMQVPGVTPEWMANQLIRRLDDRLDPADAFAASMPSIQMMNASGQINTGQVDPTGQGAAGGANAQSTQPAQVNEAPRPPDGTQNPAMPQI